MAIQSFSEVELFTELESNVRSYCRSFPAVFSKAQGHTLWDTHGKEYIDFFSGAGALNYGHNHPRLKQALLRYIENDGITHSLDMYTEAKARFLERFADTILSPRKMRYRLMFPGPTGTNSVESALKLARKITRRESVISFTNAFHGMTLGSLAISGNQFKRDGAGVPLPFTVHMPYDGYFGSGIDTIEYLQRFLHDLGSGVSLPAAVIVETIQGEGGVNVARAQWLREVEKICREYDILFIIDDVQVGCGRTGPFFSFEGAGITPDIVCLSKSISGYGLPMALTLIRPDLDEWEPGEHNGTFRGNNLAFVTATESLAAFWQDTTLSDETRRKGQYVEKVLHQLSTQYAHILPDVRGRGLIWGLAAEPRDDVAARISAEAFSRGLVIETSGSESNVLKILPPLTITDQALEMGLGILADAVRAVIQSGA